MSLPINIRIKIVLLMAKFESHIVVKRKLSIDFGKNTPRKDCIKNTFERFCETDTVQDRERSGRSSKIIEEKLDEIHGVFKN
jgi:hypothetical protein